MHLRLLIILLLFHSVLAMANEEKMLLLCEFKKILTDETISPYFVFDAIRSGDLDRLRKLVSQIGPELSEIIRYGLRPLSYAVSRNRIESVRILLEAGVSVNVQSRQGHTALHIASYLGHSALIRLLLQFGANPWIANGRHEYPIDLAKFRQRVDAQNILSEIPGPGSIRYGEPRCLSRFSL